MSQRDLLRMESDEVDRYLANSFRARLATLNADGSPHVVPVSYVLLDGSIAFFADSGSQKVVNARRDPRVACIIDDGVEFQELRGVEVIGQADIVEDTAMSERLADLFSQKVPEEHRAAAREQLLALAAERVAVVVKPRRVNSWDHHKMFGVRPQDIGK